MECQDSNINKLISKLKTWKNLLLSSGASNFIMVIYTLCNPVVPVGSLLDALQNYSAVNCFKNSFTKVILCLKAKNFRILTLLLEEYRWK